MFITHNPFVISPCCPVFNILQTDEKMESYKIISKVLQKLQIIEIGL